MNWIKLESIDQLLAIEAANGDKKSVIFKHSTRCSISATALNRIERNFNSEWVKNADFYYLDLIQYREISNKIAIDFNVKHESPQILIIENGGVLHSESHMNINPQLIEKFI